MDPVRSSLRFVVGTALLTTAGAACTEKPVVNTVANDGKAGPEPGPGDPAPVVDARTPLEKADDPPPIINAVPSPPEPEPPIVNTLPDKEPPIVNTVPTSLEPQKTPRPPTVNTVPTPPNPPRVNTIPTPEPAPDKPKKIVNTRPDVEKLDE